MRNIAHARRVHHAAFLYSAAFGLKSTRCAYGRQTSNHVRQIWEGALNADAEAEAGGIVIIVGIVAMAPQQHYIRCVHASTLPSYHVHIATNHDATTVVEQRKPAFHDLDMADA